MMVHTCEAVVDLVLEKYRGDFERAREDVVQVVSGSSPNRLCQHDLIGISVVDPGVSVLLTWLLRDARPWGSFVGPTWLLTVVVRCRTADAPDDNAHSVRGFDFENEGWARAALGEKWADYAYQIEAFSGSARPKFFHVLVDERGDPQLAPHDFEWIQSGPGGLVERHKLRPGPESKYVIGHLRRYGDLLPAT